MNKRAFCLVLALVLVLGLAPAALAADAGLGNFVKVNTYVDGQFTDVPAGEWFVPNVKTAFELNLIKGSSPTSFRPAGNINIAETLALASRLHSIYYHGSADFTQGSPWYQVYVDYAVQNGIIYADEYSSYTVNATRAQFASILASALPTSALTPINSVAPGAIPDVPDSAPYADKVYLLYNAGVLTGNNIYGSFTPNTPIQRNAVAAIVTRMADPMLRRTFTLQPPPVAVTGIALSQTSASLNKGSVIQLTATVSPSDAADKTVTWSSSNPQVATVSSYGQVTGIGAGTAVITASASNGVKATCTVTVTVIINGPPSAKLACIEGVEATSKSMSDAMDYLQLALDSSYISTSVRYVQMAQQCVFSAQRSLEGSINACGTYSDMQTAKGYLNSAYQQLKTVPSTTVTSTNLYDIALKILDASKYALPYVQKSLTEFEKWVNSMSSLEVTLPDISRLMDFFQEVE